ncbi:MAG: ester cyclase [Terracidiphilus sp.]
MTSNMLPDEMKALVRRRFEALDEGNFGILDEIFQPSYQLNVPGIPGPLSLDATKRLYQTMYQGFPDLKHNIVEQVAADDKVVTRWVATGTHSGNFMGVAPTGKRVEFAGINVYTIDHRLFAQSQVNWDLLSLFRQIGAATVNANLDVG